MKTRPDDRVFHTNVEIGLTKREYFAAKALEGLLAGSGRLDDVSGIAVMFADELIEALNASVK